MESDIEIVRHEKSDQFGLTVGGTAIITVDFAVGEYSSSYQFQGPAETAGIYAHQIAGVISTNSEYKDLNVLASVSINGVEYDRTTRSSGKDDLSFMGTIDASAFKGASRNGFVPLLIDRTGIPDLYIEEANFTMGSKGKGKPGGITTLEATEY